MRLLAARCTLEQRALATPGRIPVIYGCPGWVEAVSQCGLLA